jgi:ABC-type branched-subunit amino acid transport system substrate-binding protein
MQDFFRSAVICVLALTCVSFGQGESAAVFKTAKELYRQGKYDKTVTVLREHLREHGKEESTEYIVPLLLEALVRTGDFATFKRLMGIYERKYPESRYMPRLLYLHGVVQARQGDYEQAVLTFSRALGRGLPPSLQRLAIKNVEVISRKAFALAELERLSRYRDLDPRVAEILTYYEFMTLDRTNQDVKARQRADEFRRRYPDSRYIAFAKEIAGRSRSGDRNQIQLGLLAPISGYDADIGRQVVQGVQLAVDEHNASGGQQVKLVISDTKGDMIQTTRKTDELVSTLKTPAIIGPILSQNAVVTASMLMKQDAVMVTPTATDEGIARLGDNIFQVNVTLGMLGRRIARYAIENLHIKDFAIIAPMTDYGMIMADAFKEEVRAQGAEIIAEEFFDEGTTDFRMQILDIRSKLLQRRQQREARAQGVEFSAEADISREDSLYFADSTMAVGGVFIPAEAEDVVMIAPQLSFHRIRAQLLGSNGWHNAKTLLDGKKYVADALISSNFEVNMSDQQWVSFARRYKQTFNTEPDQVVAPLGYDAARLLLSAVEQAGGNSREIARRLRETSGYVGVSGPISFDRADGANTETAIFKIKNKEFVRIQ